METIISENPNEIAVSSGKIDLPQESRLKEHISLSNDDTIDPDITAEKSNDKYNLSVIDQNYKFYLEFCKLHEANMTLNAHLTALLKEKAQLKTDISKLEVSFT
jgi:hypothetical protein